MKQFNQPSVMKHEFSRVPKADIPRSRFDRSHGNKTTMNAGDLVPIFIDQVLPGDTLKLDPTLFARLATALHPTMDNMFLDTFYFFVPYRLVWENWERFLGAQDNPDDSTDYLIPTLQALPDAYPLSPNQQLFDYFGIPMGQGSHASGTLSALPSRAYNLIWNEWFRDENLQDAVPVLTNDGPDSVNTATYKVLQRGKRHDYFTSCLPWPQKGDSVLLPLGDTAPVLLPDTSVAQTLRYTSSGAATGAVNANAFNVTNLSAFGNAGTEITLDPDGSWVADLSDATAATINQIRQAFQVQKMLERDARGGTRYVELLLSHFGVSAPDYRLQRPEYLGGGSTPININPIASTATDPTLPQGNLAGIGTALSTKKGFNKSFVEHGVVIGLANVRADLTYQQGIERFWSYQTKYDIYWPATAHLGEQAVLNKELYFSSDPDVDNEVFGYQERFAEYRYKPSKISGAFRSEHPQSLDTWHLSQDFASLPTLSSEFITDNPPIDRIIAVTDEPQFLLDCYFKYNCARPMPVYSVPGLVDHF